MSSSLQLYIYKTHWRLGPILPRIVGVDGDDVYTDIGGRVAIDTGKVQRPASDRKALVEHGGRLLCENAGITI